jgi:hypothetical protein
MPREVVLLPLVAVRQYESSWSEQNPPPAAEVGSRRHNPESRRTDPELRQSVIDAPGRARREGLIGGMSYQVALEPEDATALNDWCRAVALLSNPGDCGLFVDAADTIDAAK